MSDYDYRVFGLKVRSELELPELFADGSDAAPDVTISRGPVNCAQPGPGLHADGAALVLVIPDVARFRIADGASMTVDPGEGVPERNVRLFLLGSAFGALLHQRGLLPLHANAIEIEGNAVAFMGPSGAGKSTLAAWFHDRGHRLLADDVCVIGADVVGRAIAFPGLPRLRLWIDALETSGRSTDGLDRSYTSGDEQLDKFDLPVRPHAMAERASPLAGLYLLGQADSFGIERLSGVEAAQAIFENTYRGSFIAAAGVQRGHWESATNLARMISVYRVGRTKRRSMFDAEAGLLLDHIRARRG